MATTSSLLVVYGLLVLQLSSVCQVEALCKCAEVFPSSKNLEESNHGFFDPVIRNGETRVFTAMSFHCKATLISMRYKGLDLSCRCYCGLNSTVGSGEQTLPQFQLWRQNGSIYVLKYSQLLSMSQAELTLNWNVERDDAIGLWIPSSLDECQDISESNIKIGYLYGRGSKNYRIRGFVDAFNMSDYSLENGPMPMIAVKTDKEYDLICIIGLPVGTFVGFIALCLTTCAVCCTIRRERLKRKGHTKGALVITHTRPEYIEGDEQETELRDIAAEIATPPAIPTPLPQQEYENEDYDEAAVYEELPENVENFSNQSPTYPSSLRMGDFAPQFAELDEPEDEYVTNLRPPNNPNNIYANGSPRMQHSESFTARSTSNGGYTNVTENRRSTLY